MISFELKCKLFHYSVTKVFTFKHAAIDSASHTSSSVHIQNDVLSPNDSKARESFPHDDYVVAIQ